MKTCIRCGAVLSDEAAVCSACGVVQPAPQPVVEQPAPQPVHTPPVCVAPPAPHYVPVQPEKQSVSVGGWIGRYCLNLIPFVGGLVFFIMLWVWASKKSNEDSFRNWAKSRLVWMAIGIGIGLLAIILMLALGFTATDLMDEMRYY